MLAVLMIVLILVVTGAAFLITRQNARVEEVLRASREQLQSEQARAVDQESRRQALESAIRSLEDKLKEYRDLLKQWESDRERKFGQLEKELETAASATGKLQETTGKLTNILGNVKLRGQWGERMAEDIIAHVGLIENVNYVKQPVLGSSSTRPDFSFLLPNERRINMDVKFPLDNYLKMFNAVSDIEKENAKKEFMKNVRARVKEIQSRDYINPAENTLDFVLLFIPNEQVFAFINETEPLLLDESLRQKVVLCSPLTLYATLSVIRQAHEQFRFEKDLKKIIGHMELFSRYFETFKERFQDIGSMIGQLASLYSDINEKSFKNLDAKMRHIEDFKKGHSRDFAGDLTGLSDKVECGS